MSRTKILSALALGFIASPNTTLGAQTPFQGTVQMNITTGSGTTQLNLMLKDGKTRFDPSPQMSVIIDPVAQRMMVIMNAQRMYMERDFTSATAAVQQQFGGKAPTIARTGKFDTIAGYKCEHVTITDDDGGAVDACVSQQLGGFRIPTASNPMAPQKEAGWITQLGATNFPLKVTKGGKTVVEVTAIEKKAMDAGMFEAPEGFQSFAMPAPKKPRL